MDIRTLPEDERELYNSIRKKYKLTFDRLQLGDDTVRLLKVADLEQFLDGKDPFANVSEFPFWIRLWDSAMVLSYLLHSLPDAKGQRLLELGAGLGAPGLAAAVNGFDVTLSDYEEIILNFEKVSAAASKLDNVQCTMLDWLDPPEMEQFDVLAGAEILFREEFFDPLLSVFRKYLKPGGIIYLAHDGGRKSLPKFLKVAENEYDISGKVQKIRKDGKDVTIIINRLLLKKS
ncbi:methyltransferase [Desulfopila sp. IMCC35008]|uniref:class I SAM-dependent methyltransferase n=1 Tax=Desulfopila sp. IMCC35008 TaxID=2653858 RepID=UPI0013D81B81|nr:methyltransferase domain-containing protein [Desulfopila sp. IMCC35008]